MSLQLHNNRLASLPETFADLPSLTNLDLSHNQLTSFPVHFYALPALKTLNVSHNALTSLAFNSSFTEEASTRSRYRTDEFFTPAVVTADTPLPRLISLNASHNKISAAAIDSDSFPQSITQLDLSYNPITSGSGAAAEKLFSALANLPKLEQVHMKAADLDDRAFPSNLLHSSRRFEKIQLLDLEETQVTRDAVVTALSSLSRDLEFDVTAPDTDSASPSGLSPTGDVPKPVKIIVGKKVVREAWEVEADRRAKLRSMRSASSLRAAAQAQTEAEQPPLPVPSTSQKEFPRAARPAPKVAVQREVVKEQWEIEAEQGLLTEGGRRRARALAVQQASAESSSSQNGETNASTLLKAKYWDEKNHTLSLPPVAPPNRLAHGRGFSLASSPSMGPGVDTDLTLPIAALPLSLVVSQSFADTLRVLELKGRRADSSFILPEGDGPFLPRLEELYFEGCNLGDEVSLVVGEEKKREPLFPTLARLLPNMRTLDLSLNLVTSQHLTVETLSSLVLSSPGRPGLKRLILRGNRLAGLDGFAALAKDIFASEESSKARWTLEELDVRDNAIEKLNGELGLLPLEVFLVEGNV
ncbi:hypothetical protein EWM64_g3842 [Hericium alpestre]|uniref:Uncharacterized protein n=1 Tax=Hericium alpestre TaxID=135208 RepID=A0A4Z0A1W4_9AGAM|nr:hypothetical protein EWM64_g3842 [Hericium alpestre]